MEKNAPDTEKNLPGPEGSGAPGTGPASPTAQEQTRAPGKNPAPRPAERATALRGQGIGRPPAPKSAVRRQTQGDIFGKDPEIPYVKFEAAARDLVCALMERQDRMNEEIFYRINDLAYRLDDLEEDRQENGGGG
jgi:hypothetical protein